MELTRHDDAAGFLEAIEPALMPREAEHSLLLGAALDLRRAPPSEGEAPVLATVRDGRGLVVAALLAGGRPLVLAGDRPDTGGALDLLVAELARLRREPEAVQGRVEHAQRFAELWNAATGIAPRLAMRQRLHALTALQPVPVVPGRLRPARPEDLPLLVEWKAAFQMEALGETDIERARAIAERRLAGGELYLWEDGVPCAMAGSARPTRGTIAVNGVYTPPEARGRGYATSCVARLSERLLAGGRTCVLFTDLANPTSNAIYARIGYRPVADFAMHRFDR